MSKSKEVFVVKVGEEFEVHIAGSDINLADPMGLIGGRTYELAATSAGLLITGQRVYSER